MFVYEFLWEMESGDLGSYLVEGCNSQYEAIEVVKKENSEIIDCLVEIIVIEV